ncbi:MAG: VWA domain-containing protein [Archangium sp.]|nr:VWA domain-containing protein [Archangium sp.]
MNRTTAFLASAAALLLIAVVAKVPRAPLPAPTPPPVPTVAPTPTPPPVTPVVVTPSSTSGALSLTGKLSHPYLVAGTRDVFTTLEVSAVDVPGAARTPVNFAMVIDRSGSMGGAKIEHARRAAEKLVDLLGPNDRLAIIDYGTDVHVTPGRFVTEENRAILRRAVRAITDEGGTNIGEALLAGEKQLAVARSDFRVNRLLLVSDGQPTVGLTSAQGLANVVQRIRRSGLSVTALGVGTDFNEDLMQRLASLGGGAYGFIDNTEDTARLFEKDLQQAAKVVATNVEVRVKLPPGVALRQVFGREARTEGNVVHIPLSDFSAKQVERLVLHLSANAPAGAATVDVASADMTYRDVLAERDASDAVSLAAVVTPDATLAEAKRDATAVVLANRARAAQNYQKAATAMERGDFDSASQLIRGNDALFEEAEAVGGKDVMAADKAGNEAFFGLSTAAPAKPAEEQRRQMKALKVQSLRGAGFGESSVY